MLVGGQAIHMFGILSHMKKTVRLWYLYDFANSFASIVLLFYYPLILIERGASNAWVGISASIATVILLFVLPYLGAYSDRTGKKFLLIKYGAVGMVASLVSLAYLLQGQQLLDTGRLSLLSLVYILFYVSFHSSYLFYASMLRTISENSNNVKVSGVGLGFGQLGNALALLILGPIVASSFIIAGLQGKPLALFLGGISFAIISLPFLLQKDEQKSQEKMHFSYTRFLKEVLSNKKLLYFLIGCSLLANAVLTFQLYISIYLKKVFHFSDQLITYASIVALLSAVVGGFCASKIAERLKGKQVTLQTAAIVAATCFGICAIVPNVAPLVFSGLILSGFSYGLVFSLSRAIYSEIIPEKKQGEFFSIFIVFERAASVIGPVVWLTTFFVLTNFSESLRYRGSMFLLLVISLGGFYFLRKSKRV